MPAQQTAWYLNRPATADGDLQCSYRQRNPMTDQVVIGLFHHSARKSRCVPFCMAHCTGFSRNLYEHKTLFQLSSILDYKCDQSSENFMAAFPKVLFAAGE